MTDDEYMQLAKDFEAYETPAWAVEEVLKVELLTVEVLDPCCGYGVLEDAVHPYGSNVTNMDILSWGYNNIPKLITKDFFTHVEDLSETTVLMNPPFSKACQFVDHARVLGARKIICFQRYAWREGALTTGKKRGAWWEANPPARIWLCGDRAQCLRFDLRGQTMASPPTAHAWFVWERGHRGAEITRGLYKGHQYHV